MFVHLGGDTVVVARDVVAILDARLLEQSEVNRELVARAAEARKLHGLEVGGPGAGPACKSLVVAVDGVYKSGISTTTLARRMTHFRQSAISWEA